MASEELAALSTKAAAEKEDLIKQYEQQMKDENEKIKVSPWLNCEMIYRHN